MHLLELAIDIKSPLHVKSHKFHGNVNETLSYIPGSTLYGALGNYILRTQCSKFKNNKFHSIYSTCVACEQKCAFYNIIVTPNQLICNDALKCNENVKHEHVFRNLNTLVVCRKNKEHIFDLLLHLLRNSKNDDFKCLEVDCRSDLKRKTKSVYYLKNGTISSLHGLSVTKKLLTKTGINRKTRSSKEKYLYYLRYIEPNQTFKTRLLFQDEHFSIIKEALEGIELVGLGGNRNRGFGQVEVSYSKKEYQKEVNERIRQFQENTELISNKLDFLDDEQRVLIVTLKSELIFMPLTLIPTGPELIRAINYRGNTNIPEEGIKLHKIFVKKINRNLYLEQDSLKSLAISAIDAGSILVYLIEKKILDNHAEDLIKAEFNNIGWMPERGFGNFICNSEIYTNEKIQV
ncbi:MAG: RAMP superfamily CRISPR-associated protein [Candidatus Helarchaeota archaeon]